MIKQFLGVLFACALCTVSLHAQKSEIIKQSVRAATQTAAKTTLSQTLQAASAAAAAKPLVRAAGSRQLQIHFKEEPIQLEIPFAEFSGGLPSAADLEQKVRQAAATQERIVVLNSGERVRVVKLEEKHFQKTHKLSSTVGHFLSVTKNPVVLPDPKTGERVTVFKNDRLRYFSDLKQVCPAGSFLLRGENGRYAFLSPEQTPADFAAAYEKEYQKNNPAAWTNVEFEPGPIPPVRVPELKNIGALFARQNGFARVYALDRHPLSAQPVQVAVLEREVKIQGLALLKAGSMAVRYPDGSFDLHPADQVPPVLQGKIAYLQFKQSTAPLQQVRLRDGEILLRPQSAAQTYSSQSELAQDLHRRGAGGKSYTSRLFGPVIAYEIPPGILYQPAGRAEERLDPTQKIVLYYPARGDGQIVPRDWLMSGFFTEVK